MTYIDQHAETLLRSDEFLQIDQALLIELFDRDQLAVEDEMSIWQAVILIEFWFNQISNLRTFLPKKNQILFLL